MIKKNKNLINPEETLSLKHWGKSVDDSASNAMRKKVLIDCGWGKLIFGQTFYKSKQLVKTLLEEQIGERDIALYVRDPQIALSFAPQSIFIDPSVTLRLLFNRYQNDDINPQGFTIRYAQAEDEVSINRIYQTLKMVTLYDGFLKKNINDDSFKIFVAEDNQTHEIIGTAMGIDHYNLFRDPDNGSSLWALAVDPQTSYLGVGTFLVRYLIMYYMQAGRSFLDLSVMHSNQQALDLYYKLGFEPVPVFCLKRKNPINEKLFIGLEQQEEFNNLNIYARIIVDKARRRGIIVEILDSDRGYFRLNYGGRSIICCESLSELTSSIAMTRCADKSLTYSLLTKEELCMPEQILVSSANEALNFLEKHKRVVVKPTHGEQGQFVFVDLINFKEIETAINACLKFTKKVIVEQYVKGEDLRVIVINNEIVAAAVRRPAKIIGDGIHSIEQLIQKQTRRREAATNGESSIPIDNETIRCINKNGYKIHDVLEEGVTLRVRKTANLHTGGTIHDVTDQIHPTIQNVALKAAQILGIPVVGLDFILPDIEGDEYMIIEANERPGLANHEPQPTAQKFIDLLFPETIPVKNVL